MITTDQVKELRDKTSVSVMQCRKALEEAGGDMEQALMILKKKSSEIALKKADREATDGIVVVAKNGDAVALLELNCETDFVAKNEDFTNLANALAVKALEVGEGGLETIAKNMIDEVIQKIGENIKLGRVTVTKGGVLGSYVHNGKNGVVVSLEGGDEALAKDIAMHIAAMNPEFTSMSDIPEDVAQKAKDLFEKEVSGSDKPEEIKQKILEGKINAYFAERTLLEQPFIKNTDETVKKLLEKNKASITKIIRSMI